jgi:hypothetical protein
MVFHDSIDWGRDLQVMLDALVSKNGDLTTIKTQTELHTTRQSVPLFFSNSDLASFLTSEPIALVLQWGEMDLIRS